MAKELKFNATISDDKVLDTLMKMKSSARETDSAIDGIKQSADAATESLVKMGDAAETAMKKASSKQVSNSEYSYMTNGEKQNYFTNSRGSARKYLTSEQDALNQLTKAWESYAQKVEAAGKTINAATLNDNKELKSAANIVYAWANSYKALGGDIDAVSDKMQLFMSEFAKTNNAKSYETMFGEGTFRNMYSALDELTKAGYSIDSLFGKTFSNLTEEAQKFITTLGLANNTSYFDKQAADAARYEAELKKVADQQQKAFTERKASSVVGLDAQSIQPLVDGLKQVVEYMDKMYTLSIETGQALKALPESFSGMGKVGGSANDGLSAMKTYREQINSLKSDINGIIDILSRDQSIIKNGNLTGTLFENSDFEEQSNRIKKMTDRIEYLIELKDKFVTGMNIAGYTGAIPNQYEQTVAAQSEQIKASYEAQRVAVEQSSAQTATVVKETNMVAQNISLSAEQAEKLTTALSSSAEASKQMFSGGTFNTNGLALEKTLQAVKSISIEIAKYLSQINEKIMSSADAEALLAAKAEQAATAIASQGKAAKEVADAQNKAIAESLKNEFGLSGGGVTKQLMDALNASTGTGSIDNVLQVIVDKLNEATLKASGFADEWKRVRDYVSKSQIHISPDFKTEFGDNWQKMRSTIGASVMRSKGGSDADAFIRELNSDLGITIAEGKDAKEAIANLYQYLSNKPDKSSFAQSLGIEDIREQADVAIDKALGLAEAEEKVKLNGEQIVAQQRQINEALAANGYGKFSTTVSNNGKIVIDNFEQEGQAAKRAIIEFKNLEAAMNSINNGTIQSKISRSSSTVDEEKYVKQLTAALVEEYRIKSEFSKIKDPNADQKTIYNTQIQQIHEKINALYEEGKAYKNVLALQEKADAIAYSKVGYKYDLKNNNTISGTTTANSLIASYNEAMAAVENLKAATNRYTPEAISAVVREVENLKKRLEEAGVVVNDSGADFSKVQQNNVKSVKNTIGEIQKLTESIKSSGMKYNNSGMAIGSTMNPIGTDAYYDDLKRYAVAQLQVNESSVQWERQGAKLVGQFRNQDKELKKVTLSAQDMDGAIRMSVSDIKEMSLAEKWLSPLTSKMKQLTIYFSSFTLMMRFINSVKEGITSIKELNTALTEFQVVTGASDRELQKFGSDAKDVAQSVASTTADVVSSAVDWSRLGYNASDSLQLAKEAAELAKVGFMDVDEATSSLTASLQGFYAGTDQAAARGQELIDKFVEVGNTMPISSAQIAEGLSNAGGVLAQAGNDVNEAIALLTSGNAALQDASVVASSLRVMSMRLRSTSASKMMEAGEDVDGLIEDASKLRKTIMELTKTEKNAQGVDILTKTGDYKSTYEIEYMSPYTEMYMRCA